MGWFQAFIYGLVLVAVYHYFMSSDVVNSPGKLSLNGLAQKFEQAHPNREQKDESVNGGVNGETAHDKEMQKYYERLNGDARPLPIPVSARSVYQETPVNFPSQKTDVADFFRQHPTKFFSNTPGSQGPPVEDHNLNLYQMYLHGKTNQVKQH